jgi:hypothetical protein
MHTCKKSTISRALARLFCGLLIGSNVGINLLWISTKDNVIANEISKLKSVSTNNPTSTHTYGYSKLQQNYEESKACTFSHPSQELLSLIWEISSTQKMSPLKQDSTVETTRFRQVVYIKLDKKHADNRSLRPRTRLQVRARLLPGTINE